MTTVKNRIPDFSLLFPIQLVLGLFIIILGSTPKISEPIILIGVVLFFSSVLWAFTFKYKNPQQYQESLKK